MSLPRRILNQIKSLEKKIVSYPFENKFRNWKQKMDDRQFNRELIVVDKYQNRYYQHYSDEGLPTKKYVYINMTSLNKWQEDPTMQGWLQGRRESPPSQEELERIYIQEEELVRRGLEWDSKERKLIEEYRTRRDNALSQEREETKAIGEGENFQPGVWLKADGTELAKRETELTEYENIHGLKGKYYMDFKEEDEKWIKEQEEKRLAPLQNIYDMVNLEEYSTTAMSARYHNKLKEVRESNKLREKELTNMGKKMLDKREKFKSYSQFREKFSDVYETLNFGKDNVN